MATAIAFVLTLLILYASEIIPKTIGAIYWKSLLVPAAYLISFMIKVTYPLVWFSGFITNYISQGKKDEIYKRYWKYWNIREQGGGNGNWLLTRKSDVLVDGKSYRTFVLEHYGKSKLTAKLVDKFREDVANGKIKL